MSEISREVPQLADATYAHTLAIELISEMDYQLNS